MPIKSVLSVVAGLLFIVGFVPYIRAILRGETKPAKATWVIWASMDTIIMAGMYAKGALNGQILGVILGAWTVFVLAMKYGMPGWTKLDKFCLSGAALSIVPWYIFSNPVFSIAINLGVGFFGSIPLFASAWKDPSREDKLAWTIFWVSCVCAVIAIPQWTLADAAQPIVFFAIETIMMYILYFRSRLAVELAE